jgi:hypothetical protein
VTSIEHSLVQPPPYCVCACVLIARTPRFQVCAYPPILTFSNFSSDETTYFFLCACVCVRVFVCACGVCVCVCVCVYRSLSFRHTSRFNTHLLTPVSLPPPPPNSSSHPPLLQQLRGHETLASSNKPKKRALCEMLEWFRRARASPV